MITIKIHIDNETRKSIKNIYAKDDYTSVRNVVENIIDRY